MDQHSRDLYEVLNISRSATAVEIKKAYRSLAMKYHPDRNPGDKVAEEKFKEVRKAYEVLSNDEKRRLYDQFGEDAINAQFGQGGGAGFAGGIDLGDIFGNIFGDLFGQGRERGSRAQRGADLVYNLTLTLEEAVHGKTVKIKYPTLVNCDVCSGTGAKPGTSPVNCSTCGGHGQVHIQQGFIAVTQTCPDCHGRGTVIKSRCAHCQGRGQVEKEKKLTVKVPAGVDNGDRIRLSGEGEAGLNDGPSGDLFVQIKVKPHPFFTREANDLFCEVPVSFATVTLGGELDVPTLNGSVKLKIPPATQTHKQFRLRGQGVKSARSGVMGDLFCRVVVETPVNLTREQKAALEKLEGSLLKGGAKHSPKSKNWFDNVKRFFEGLSS